MITKNEAIHLAGKHFQAWIARKYSNITFSPMQLVRETDEAYMFLKSGKEWQAEGRCPGALFVMVDKKDGRIMDDAEWQAVFAGKEYKNGSDL